MLHPDELIMAFFSVNGQISDGIDCIQSAYNEWSEESITLMQKSDHNVTSHSQTSLKDVRSGDSAAYTSVITTVTSVDRKSLDLMSR